MVVEKENYIVGNVDRLEDFVTVFITNGDGETNVLKHGVVSDGNF